MAIQNNWTGAKSEEFCPAGMTREEMKDDVLKKLTIGQQYRLKSLHAANKEYPVSALCRLIELSVNVAVFKHKNGYAESFTYPDLWIQMMCGDFA